MAGESVTSGNSTRPTLVAPELIKELREHSVLMPIPKWRDSKGAAGVAFSRITSSHSMSSVSNGAFEADAITPTALTTSSATATPAAKVAAVLASWVLILGSSVNLQAEIPALLARAGMQALDVDVCTLGIAGSNTTGSTGVPMTVTQMQDTVTLAQRVALGVESQFVFVMHPKSLGDARQDAISNGNQVLAQANVQELFPGGAGSSLSKAVQGTFNGIPVIKSSNVQDMNVDADHGNFLIATQYAIGGAMMMAPMTGLYDQGANHKPATSWFHAFIYGLIEAKDEGIITALSDHA
jgi:hypothetical protein